MDNMRVESATRWVLGADGRVKEALVDVYRVTGLPVWLAQDKVFRTEVESRKHALEVCEALKTKFGLLAEEHQKRIQELDGLKVGDRFRDTLDGDEGKVLAIAPNGELFAWMDKPHYEGSDAFAYSFDAHVVKRLVKI